MSGYLLDTNHLSIALSPVSTLSPRLRDCILRGFRVGVCAPVLCEMEAGLRGLTRPEEHRRTLTELLGRIRIWPLDATTARIYGEIYQDLRGRGRVLSQVDMMIASLARQMGLTILTRIAISRRSPDLPSRTGSGRPRWEQGRLRELLAQRCRPCSRPVFVLG